MSRSLPSGILLVFLISLFPHGCEGSALGGEELSAKEFKQRVIDSQDVWVILFYAPWCGHCKALFPEWKKFADAVSPSIKVGQVNADEHKDLAGQYGVKGFPTIKLFSTNKRNPSDYNGQRNAKALAQFALKAIQDAVMGRLGGVNSEKESSSSRQRSGGKSHVLNSKEDWLVQFMAPWCGHCQRLKPEWEDAANQLAGEFKLGVVDATAETGLAGQYGVQGYPTIKLFKSDNDGKKIPVDYNGGRTASDIVQYVTMHLESTGTMRPIPEINSLKVFKDECNEDWHGICVLTFLPQILDDQSAGRNARLNKLSEVKKKVGRTFRFMWTSGGESYELEEKMGLGFGYPALVAISPSKRRYAVMRGKFEISDIDLFLSNVLRGREATSELKPWPPSFAKYPEWDGKDAVVEGNQAED
ncbi:hypothetical protein GUITHDRAFT_164660 [Guillardia theta CCMP2712]|uniref:protein disulfide-isomerase n=1 Tax=Guillardia theta (strain CCMP2712) TaxID=905079 RepID=L1IVY3_GUITC|nr:hypothetical protein GUITHDRAFT_164660 [Guillardia theta CCMP2712]EKX40413.1 hypothetical protein GUITHDRAFT_164660 [Guillardia theta CCMP2712]|eukprot:XP_005827393.1 hypothetical protein GUITHDRAFT_164660 [Guillardia theta CCMP2712]